MVGVSLALVFFSMIGMILALFPDMTRQLIHQRVYKEVSSAGAPPTLLSQLAESMAPINRRLPIGLYSRHMEQRLVSSGMYTMTPLQFLVLQQLAAITGALLYYLSVGAEEFNIAWMGLTMLVVGFLPYLWLHNKVQARRATIARDLPEIVDLLSLSVEAGVDFMSALARVVKEFRPCPTTEELELMLQEVRVGKRRRDALRAFSHRVQTPATSSFSRTLVQADRMGTGVVEALRILSEDMRNQRFHWAERFAAQAPLKMLLPLLFSLASALIIVAGPILGEFLGGEGGFSAMQSLGETGGSAFSEEQ